MSAALTRFEQRLTGRRVFLTGHTGFTGGRAALWLQSTGAEVLGYALAPDTGGSGLRDHQQGLSQPRMELAVSRKQWLGGKDPYSASKSAAEMAIATYGPSLPMRDGRPRPEAAGLAATSSAVAIGRQTIDTRQATDAALPGRHTSLAARADARARLSDATGAAGLSI